jgi:tRNA pseudouridine65 synthase
MQCTINQNYVLEIIFQDDDFVAINKPSGLLVHRSEIDRHETRFAMQIVRDHLGQRVYPLHRLDKPTSGVLLFALSQSVAKAMMPAFSSKQVQKHYLAIVRGYTKEHEVIDYPLKEQLDRMTDAQAKQDKPAQQAITEYRRLKTITFPIPVRPYQTSRYSLLKLSPHTGRKHQLRRHMKHIFHPIVGDTSHGDGKHNEMFRREFDCHRLMLHAREICFPCPHSGKPIRVRAPFDEVWKRIFLVFDWANECS